MNLIIRISNTLQRSTCSRHLQYSNPPSSRSHHHTNRTTSTSSSQKGRHRHSVICIVSYRLSVKRSPNTSSNNLKRGYIHSLLLLALDFSTSRNAPSPSLLFISPSIFTERLLSFSFALLTTCSPRLSSVDGIVTVFWPAPHFHPLSTVLTVSRSPAAARKNESMSRKNESMSRSRTS